MPLIVALAFIAGLFADNLLNHHAGPTPTQKKFQTILNLIRNDYVDNVNLDSLLENSIPGLLSNLDPHSAYIPASELQAVNDELDGSFCGIGVQFMINNDTITVVEVVSGGPSEKIGIKATIRDYVPDEADFLARLDDMVEQAFDDQCTGANPRYPLMSELKEMYLRAYYGE